MMSAEAAPAVVFGASGFIGSHVAAALRAQGRAVSAPLRCATPFLQGLGCQLRHIDFDVDEELQACMPAASEVYVCLANPRRHLPLAALRAVEVELTTRVLRAAARAGVRRVVLLSSIMVHGFATQPRPLGEMDAPQPQHAFSRVAWEREVAAHEVADELELELVILRPGLVFGRRDRQMRQLWMAARHGLFPLFAQPPARFSAVDARDVGRAMVWLGACPQAAGQTYLLKGFDTSWAELRDTLALLGGRRIFSLSLPTRLARALGYGLEVLLPYGVEPPLSRFSVDVMSSQLLLDDARLRATGFVPQHDLVAALTYAQS